MAFFFAFSRAHGQTEIRPPRVEAIPPRPEDIPPKMRRYGVGTISLSLSLSYIITRVAPHCVNTLRILHAAYDATNTTRPLVNTHSVR